MHYIINVSKRHNIGDSDTVYQHLFATAPHSCQDKWQCKKVYEELAAKFPEPEYNIEIWYYENAGRSVKPSELYTVYRI